MTKITLTNKRVIEVKESYKEVDKQLDIIFDTFNVKSALAILTSKDNKK